MIVTPPDVKESDVLAALRTFLLDILPAACEFTGSIDALNQLTVTSVASGAIYPGAVVSGPGIGAVVTIGSLKSPGLWSLVGPSVGPLASAPLETQIPVLTAQQNRVPEPTSPDFVIMTPTGRPRLALNIDTYADCAFNGSIAGTTLTVASMIFGEIADGTELFGTNIADGTEIVAQLSGTPGGVGTYQVSLTQTIASEKMACGVEFMLQKTQIVIQLDIHGPNSADNNQLISTVLMDDTAFEKIQKINANVAPLYADVRGQMPFINDQQQFEWRWVIEANLEANITVIRSKEFFDQALVTLKPINAYFPPS